MAGEASKRAPAAATSQSAAPAGARTYLNLAGISRKFVLGERATHNLVAEKWFPAPVQLVGGTRGIRRWIEQEIDEAVAARAPRSGRRSEPEQLARARTKRAGHGSAEPVAA